MGEVTIKGFVFNVEMIDGIPEGKGVAYYPSGVVQKEVNFKDGVLNGESLTFNMNGELYEHEHYKDGVLHGKYILYYTNGRKILEGKSTERKKLCEGQFLLGLNNGEFRYYYHNGNISSKITYVGGEKDGYEYLYERDTNYKIMMMKKYDVGLFKEEIIYSIEGYITYYKEVLDEYTRIRVYSDQSMLVDDLRVFKIGTNKLTINLENLTVKVETNFNYSISTLVDEFVSDLIDPEENESKVMSKFESKDIVNILRIFKDLKLI